MAVVNAGSFFGASDSLAVARTTIKRRIEALEARVGAALIRRDGARLTATRAGEILVERGAELLEQADAIVAAARGAEREFTGTIRMVGPLGLPPWIAASSLSFYSQTFPKISFQLSHRPDPVTALSEGFDVALILDDEPPGGPWRAHVLLQTRDVLVASVGYLDRHGRPTSIAELLEHRLVAWQAHGDDATVWPLTEGGHFAVEPFVLSDDMQLVRTFAETGRAISLTVGVPATSLTGVKLEVVLPDLVSRPRTFRLLVPDAVADQPRMRTFVELHRQLAKHLEADAL